MSVMKIWQITIGVVALCLTVSAAETQTCRDAQGRTAGTAMQSGGGTTYRDARGRTRGTKR